MNPNKKGANSKSKPQSKKRITGESFTLDKDTKRHSFEQQFKRLDFAFSNGIFTMKAVSVRTGIDRANICRFVANYRKENRIYLVKFGICPITKAFRVGFYTTNYELYLSLKTLMHGK